MKKTFLLAIISLVATTTVTAQDFEMRGDRRGPDPEKRIEHQVKRLDKNLNLTPDQKELLIEFYGEFDKAQMARMEQMRRMEMRDRIDLDKKIKSILTEEQKAKYDEMKEKDKEMWKEGRDGRGFGPRRGHDPRRGGPGRMGQGGFGGFGGEMGD